MRFKTQIDKLEDTDPMPFGQYKSIPMQDVSARYLHWLWTQSGLRGDKGAVSDYIRRNLPAMRQEYPDGVWS